MKIQRSVTFSREEAWPIASIPSADISSDQTKIQRLLSLIPGRAETEGRVHFQYFHFPALSKSLKPEGFKVFPIFREQHPCHLLYDQNLRVWKFSKPQGRHRLEYCRMIFQEQAHLLGRNFASKVMKDLRSHFNAHIQEAWITGAMGALTSIFQTHVTFTNLLESNIPDADLLNLNSHVFIDFVWKGDLVWKRANVSYHSCSEKAKTIRLMLKITQFLTCLCVDSVIIHRSICLGWNVYVHRVISYLDTYHFIRTQSFIHSLKLNSTSNVSALEMLRLWQQKQDVSTSWDF